MGARCTLVTLLLAAGAMAQPAPDFPAVQYAIAPKDNGASASLVMDVFQPNSASGPTAAVVWIHGGGWRSGTYRPVSELLLPLLDREVALVSVRYRLSTEAIFPAQIHDIKGAVRYLRANAGEFNIDPDRIAVWGSSAGGHLAALLGTSGGVSAAEGNTGGNTSQSSRVVAVVDYFGPTDLFNMQLDVTNPPGSAVDHDDYTSNQSVLIGFDEPGEGVGVLRANQNSSTAPFPEKMSLIRLASPITHASSGDPPFFIAHGTDDRQVPTRQSQKLYDALVARSVDVTLRIIPGAGHASMGAETDQDARDFLVSHLMNRAEQPSPASGKINVSVSSSLSWADGGGATSFDVYLGTQPQLGSGDLVERVGSERFNPGGLQYGTTYYWRVDARNDSVVKTGETWSFTTKVAPPAAPSEPSPASNSEGLPTAVTLSWSHDGTATWFLVYVGTSASLTTDYRVARQTEDTYSLSGLIYDTTYYWRVDARNAGGTTKGSVWQFKTAAASAAGKPLAPLPADGATGVAKDIMLAWSAGENTASFDLYLGTDPGLQGAEPVSGLVVPSFAPAARQLSTTYYWRVDARSVQGVVTTGDIWRFRTADPPPVPEPPPPSDPIDPPGQIDRPAAPEPVPSNDPMDTVPDHDSGETEGDDGSSSQPQPDQTGAESLSELESTAPAVPTPTCGLGIVHGLLIALGVLAGQGQKRRG